MGELLRVSAETLFNLEHELSDPRFMDVPIGSTLGDIYYLYLFLGHKQWSFYSNQKAHLHFWYHYLSTIFRRPKQCPHYKARPILITITNYREDIHRLMVPVVERIGPQHCTVLLRNKDVLDRMPKSFNVVFANQLVCDRELWKQEFKRCFPSWRVRLEVFLKSNGIPRHVLPSLYDAMVIQTQRIVAYHQLLEALAPQVIITDYDRSSLASGLILAAKARNIPTLTMFHGVINPPYGYVPLLADQAFCWGQQSFDQMVAMGTNPNRLSIVGCQHITPSLSAERISSRAKFNVTDNRPLILLASNMVTSTERKRFVRHFCEALSEDTQFATAIRLHPSENLQFYAKEIRDFPSITFTEAKKMSQDEALSAADVVVSRNSSFANEALLKGKFVIIFDVIDAPLGNASALIERAHCPYVRDKNELLKTIKCITSNLEFQEKLRHNAQEFLNYQFAAFGEQALDNIMAVIREQTSVHIN